MEFKGSKEYDELFDLVQRIKDKFDIDPSEMISQVSDKTYIPTSIFKKPLSPLETIVKYLKENLGFSFTDIGKSLQRSSKTIWQAYNSSKKKSDKKLKVSKSGYMIALEKLSDRNHTVFALLIEELIDNQGLTYAKAAKLLDRDDRTIWTIYNRIKGKRHG